MNTPWWAALSSYSSSDVDLVCIPASHCRRKTCWMSERCCICCFQPRSRTEEAASLPPSPFFQREPAPNSTIWMWAKWSSALNPPHCCVGTNLRFRAGGRRRRGQRRARASRSARPLRARALRWQRCDVMFRARDARQMLVRSRAPTGSGTDAASRERQLMEQLTRWRHVASLWKCVNLLAIIRHDPTQLGQNYPVEYIFNVNYYVLFNFVHFKKCFVFCFTSNM